jgi:hypothetical protein
MDILAFQSLRRRFTIFRTCPSFFCYHTLSSVEITFRPASLTVLKAAHRLHELRPGRVAGEAGALQKDSFYAGRPELGLRLVKPWILWTEPQECVSREWSRYGEHTREEATK